MDECKFCFIICANNERYLEECLYYIDHLAVPEGYEIEKIVIRDAVSMTSGYNRAMAQSDAKYKIYLHQDVLLVNQRLLFHLLDAFQDSSVGMVGVVGKKGIMLSAEYTSAWDAGAVEVFNGTDALFFNFSPRKGEWIDVTAIDGMFMATQFDVPWDEKEFDGWDFYDISHSMQFREAGHRILVMGIESIDEIWAFHDAGQCEYDMWEKYREKFCKKYEAQGYQYRMPEWVKHIEERKEEQRKIMTTFLAKDLTETSKMLSQLEKDNLNSELAYVVCYLLIFAEEMTAYGNVVSNALQEFDEFVNEFDEVKFALRRFYFAKPDGAWEILKEKLSVGKISMKLLWVVAHECVTDPNRLWQRVFAEYQREIRTLMIGGEVLEAERLLQQLDEKWRGRDGNILLFLIRVFRREVERGVQQTVFDYSQNPDELTRHFIRLKLYFRRIELGLPEEYQREAYEYCVKTGVSDYLIFQIIQNNIFYKEQFCRNLAQLFTKEEGKDSLRAQLYIQLAESEREK